MGFRQLTRLLSSSSLLGSEELISSHRKLFYCHTKFTEIFCFYPKVFTNTGYDFLYLSGVSCNSNVVEFQFKILLMDYIKSCIVSLKKPDFGYLIMLSVYKLFKEDIIWQVVSSIECSSSVGG